MKKLLLITLLAVSTTAQSAALCQSLRDPGYKAWFEGWRCPAGYYLITTR